jgi:hypothetical protein
VTLCSFLSMGLSCKNVIIMFMVWIS